MCCRATTFVADYMKNHKEGRTRPNSLIVKITRWWFAAVVAVLVVRLPMFNRITNVRLTPHSGAAED